MRAKKGVIDDHGDDGNGHDRKDGREDQDTQPPLAEDECVKDVGEIGAEHVIGAVGKVQDAAYAEDQHKANGDE